MNRRPVSITIISWLFIATGSLGVIYHASEFNVQQPFANEVLLACSVRLLAIIGGAFMLRGCNWARWLLALWMAYHIGLSAFHSAVEVGMHLMLFGIIGYFLFRPQGSAYFRRGREAGTTR